MHWEDISKAVFVREVLEPVFIIAISFVLYMLCSHIIKKMMKKKPKRIDTKKHRTMLTIMRSVVKYFIIVIDLLLILNVYGVDTKGIIASLGVVGVVFGLAIQDLLKDIIAGLTILFENQFRVGDYIMVNEFLGEVVSLGLKTTKIKAFTGEIKIISNRMITDVTNYSMYSSMAIVDVAISYKQDIKKIEKVLHTLCQRLSKELPNLKGNVEYVGINHLGDSSIQCRIIAPCIPMEHYGIQRMIRKEVKLEFDRHHIAIPYPQVVIHNEQGI